MQQQMTVGKKLAFTSGGLVVAMVLVGVVSIYNLAVLNRTTQLIITDPLPGMAAMAATRAAALTMRGDGWRHIAQTDAAIKAQLDREIVEQKSSIEKGFLEYEKTITMAEDRALFERIKAAWPRYTEALDPVLALSRAAKMEQATAKHNAETTPAFNALRDALGAGMDFNAKRGESLAAESQQSYGRSLWVLALMLAVSSVGGAAFAFVVIRGMNKTLRQTVTELSQGAEQVASAASQVSSSSQSLAQGSSEQAASLEETSASSEEINSMARKNTENSRSAADLVEQSQQKVVGTNHALEQTVAAMGEINAQSGKISKIIKVIDEIAFQTNILALNAAVEAARAGEAGMGFAVVADEVRNLAQRCAQAARDTASLIEESIAKSNDGKTKVDQVATAIRAITEDSTKIKMLVDEVSLGSQEQARGIEQISKAIIQMEQVTQQTAANAEESASAAVELNAQSEALRDVLERLTAMVGGGEASSGHTRSVQGCGGAANSKASDRPGESAYGLSALRKAVSHQPKSTERGASAPAAHRASKEAFPLEEQFKQF